jgi:HPt (histidine-containing phosphotransfer) domain-containing protein
MEAGMNDFITKPFDETIFIKTIAQWLEIPADTGTEVSIETPSITTPASVPNAKDLYSLKTLENISRGNKDFVKKMALMFCEQAPSLVKEMQERFLEGNLEKMGALAHKLKPSIDNMEIVSLKALIRSIEKAGKEGKADAGLEKTIGVVSNTIDMVVASLQAEFRN